MDAPRLRPVSWVRVLRRYARQVLPVVLGIVVAVIALGLLSGWSSGAAFAGALGAAGVGSLALGVLSLVGNSYRSCANTARTGDRARFFAVAIGVAAVCLAMAWAVGRMG